MYTTYVCIYMKLGTLREDLSTGYGLRFSANTCGKPVLFLQKSHEVSRNLWEFTG